MKNVLDDLITSNQYRDVLSIGEIEGVNLRKINDGVYQLEESIRVSNIAEYALRFTSATFVYEEILGDCWLIGIITSDFNKDVKDFLNSLTCEAKTLTCIH